MWNKLKNLFKPKQQSPTEDIIIDPGLPEELIWQTLLLKDNEILAYKDKEGQVHYFSTRPIEPNKQYQVLVYED